MLREILLAYGAVTVIFWVSSLLRMAPRARRPEPLFGLGERVLLGVVALLAAALWGALLPAYAVGSARAVLEGRARGAVRGLRLRPAHRTA